jgi:hypothetical protein
MGFKFKSPIKAIGQVAGAITGSLTPAGLVGGMVGSNVGGMIGDKLAGAPKPGQVGSTPGGVPVFGMRKTEEFMKDAPAETIKRVELGQNNDPINRRFGMMRERVSQESNANLDKGLDVLKRRFASMGSTGSGAQLKLEQQAIEEGSKAKADQLKEMDLAQEDQIAAREEQRMLQQAQMDQQTNMAQADLNFRTKVFSFERGSKLHELDLAERQQQIDTASTEFNKRMAEQMAKPPKQGFVSRALDGII